MIVIYICWFCVRVVCCVLLCVLSAMSFASLSVYYWCASALVFVCRLVLVFVCRRRSYELYCPIHCHIVTFSPMPTKNHFASASQQQQGMYAHCMSVQGHPHLPPHMARKIYCHSLVVYFLAAPNRLSLSLHTHTHVMGSVFVWAFSKLNVVFVVVVVVRSHLLPKDIWEIYAPLNIYIVESFKWLNSMKWAFGHKFLWWLHVCLFVLTAHSPHSPCLLSIHSLSSTLAATAIL